MVIACKLCYTCEVFTGLLREMIVKQWRTAALSTATSWFQEKQKQEFLIWLYTFKNDIALLLNAIQIVTFTIQPSAPIMLW